MRPWRVQVRLNHPTETLPTTASAPTVANVAVARELCGFLWRG